MSNKEILLHCAPTLANVKIGNLFTVAYQCKQKLKNQVAEKNKLFLKKGVSVRLLKASNNRALIYIYRVKQLEYLLKKEEIRLFLQEFDYKEFSLEGVFETLEAHLEKEDFPHEIGVFLGYPLEDIRGFIRNNGKNFHCTGCWKVYHNPEQAEKIFARYKKCVKIYLQQYEKGVDMNKLTVCSG